MSPRRPNATAGMKAEISAGVACVIVDRAISADWIVNDQGWVSIARLRKGRCRSDPFGRIVGLRARRIDIGKIGRGLSIDNFSSVMHFVFGKPTFTRSTAPRRSRSKETLPTLRGAG